MATSLANETTRCSTAQHLWAATPLKQRLAAVREFRSLFVERVPEITSAIQSDVNRAPADVIASDFLPVASAAKFLLQHAQRVLRPRRVSWRPMWLIGCRDTIHRQPRGVVGIIGTWNYPIYLNAIPALHALTAGNGILWKPSEQTPKFAEALTKLFHDSGFPKDLFQCLPHEREYGPRLVEADIQYLHFTGSEPVGRKVAANLGQRLIPSTMELSGCDAFFVLPDADVRMAARAAWSGVIMNAGQTCIAVRRMFVHRQVLEAFLAEMRPLIETTPPVKLQMPQQAAQMRDMLNEARERGAGILAGPPSAVPDETVQPAVIVSENADLGVCREAIFSPLSVLIPFDDVDRAIAEHLQCRFGLAATIFSANRVSAEALALRLKAGNVVINDTIAPTAHPGTPFGGRDATGWGCSGGEEGLLEMTLPKAVSYRLGKFRPHIEAIVTRNPKAGDLMHGMLRFTHSRKLRDRWQGLKQMIRGLRG